MKQCGPSSVPVQLPPWLARLSQCQELGTSYCGERSAYCEIPVLTKFHNLLVGSGGQPSIATQVNFITVYQLCKKMWITLWISGAKICTRLFTAPFLTSFTLALKKEDQGIVGGGIIPWEELENDSEKQVLLGLIQSTEVSWRLYIQYTYSTWQKTTARLHRWWMGYCKEWRSGNRGIQTQPKNNLVFEDKENKLCFLFVVWLLSTLTQIVVAGSGGAYLVHWGISACSSWLPTGLRCCLW